MQQALEMGYCRILHDPCHRLWCETIATAYTSCRTHRRSYAGVSQWPSMHVIPCPATLKGYICDSGPAGFLSKGLHGAGGFTPARITGDWWSSSGLEQHQSSVIGLVVPA